MGILLIGVFFARVTHFPVLPYFVEPQGEDEGTKCKMKLSRFSLRNPHVEHASMQDNFACLLRSTPRLSDRPWPEEVQDQLFLDSERGNFKLFGVIY